MKRTSLAFALSALLTGTLLVAGCGGSNNTSNDTPDTTPDTNTGIDVSGTVKAPGGAIAMFAEKHILATLGDFVFNPVAAAITGLQPVTGATVDLIRVDDSGVQQGDVLATTTTSITGGYKLTIPAGVNLSGNLIVRITGQGGASMRAQVVEKQVDINPVSEFVLKKFIDEGADLDNLTTASVIKLTDQVDEFDLTADADLSTMLASLEAETGDFVEDQIAVVTATPGDAASVSGDFRGWSMDLGLHDDDQNHGVGAFSTASGIFEMSMADQGSGAVNLSFGQEEDAWSNQQTSSGGVELTHQVDIENGDGDTEAAQLDSNGVLSLQTPFEEEIDGDFGWRTPPAVERFQKVRNTDVFVASFNDASVRYLTVDSNNDNLKDAIDPAQREGDEVVKGLSIVAKKPTAMTASDMTGDFGEIFLQVELGATGSSVIRTENNILSFNGAGQLDFTPSQIFEIARTSQGVTFSTPTDTGENGIPVTFSTDGEMTIGGEDSDAFVNDSFDLLVVNSIEVEDDENSEDEQVTSVNYGTTIAVKLPDSQLDISNKVYRTFFLGIITEHQGTSLSSLRFDSFLTMNNDNTSATLTGQSSEIEKATAVAEVESFNDSSPVTESATVAVATNGETTITISDDESVTTLNGYFSHDGSMGIFHQRWVEADETDPVELGVVLLVEVDPAAAN